jgi:uncharacterized protein (UPF0303 family)
MPIDETEIGATLPEDTATDNALLAQIRAEEARLTFPHFDNGDAWSLGNILFDLAHERSLRVTVRITRGDQVLFHVAMPGTSADNDLWVERKANTVRRFGESSMLVGLVHRAPDSSFYDLPWNDSAVFSAHGGSFPVVVDGVGCIGAVTVSGLRDHEDHALVVEAIESFLDGLAPHGRVG